MNPFRSLEQIATSSTFAPRNAKAAETVLSRDRSVMRRSLTSRQRPELVWSHADDGQDVSQGALGHVPACVDWDGDCASIGVLHHVMAASDSLDNESCAFQRPDYLRSRYDRDALGASQEATRSQATLSVRVNSSGGPTTSIRASRAARRSSTASSWVAPSPTAPTPGRSWAEAHHKPSSSCSTV